MREILFRGKRIDNGEWVEGFFVAKADPLLGIMTSFILTQDIDDRGILRSNMTWHKVDPITVAIDNNAGSKWIPVTERLPEQDFKVLVYGGDELLYVNGRLQPTPCVYTGYLYDIDPEPCFFTWDKPQEIIKNVTHWMPMPQPPGGE